ncbi:hypothetical protein JCM11251_006236 [Rhodosporidiobolus azoricus]
MALVERFDPPLLERILTFAGNLDSPISWTPSSSPDYLTLRSASLVAASWRNPAQAVLAKHVRICTASAMTAIRTREAKRMLEQHKDRTEVLEVENQWGIDAYWALDRFGGKKLKGFKLLYDPLKGKEDGQAERDEVHLEWDILRHPSLVGITNLCLLADFSEPSDTTPLTLPISDLTLGKLPLTHSPLLHKAIFTGCKSTLRNISLDFTPTLNPEKAALDSLIEEFQVIAPTLENLVFLNKPNINFLMSLHSKMSQVKMPLFFSCTYPLLPNALAPFNILALAVVNNGTSLAEFRFSEHTPTATFPAHSEDDHEALVLRYLSAFGSRLDSFNMLGRRFKFVFPREWSARFVKKPEIARFLDRAGARGCDVQCGAEQKFESTAKAMEKRKGKRVAAGGEDAADDSEDSNSPFGGLNVRGGGAHPPRTIEEMLQQAVAAAAQGGAKGKGKGKAILPPPVPPSSAPTAADKGKGKGKAVQSKAKGKGKTTSSSKGKKKVTSSTSSSAPHAAGPGDSAGSASSSVAEGKGKGKAVMQ